MDKFLITGARAPAALQLARILGRSGHAVTLADSMSWAVAYRSKWIVGHIVLPPPAQQFPVFVNAAKQAITKLRPDAIICTCEEVFYWAKAAELDPEGFAPYFRANPPFCILRDLHHKGIFARLARASAAEVGVHVPETRCFGQLGEGRWVCKPWFSRFAVKTRLELNPNDAQEQIRQSGWIAQRQISGQEFCTWGFFVNGKEVCSAAYQPVFRAGQGSGIGLRSVEPGRAADFARVLALRLNYTGQLAFDWIENDAGCHVLECNPRSTSGVHFLDRLSQPTGLALSSALSGRPFQPVTTDGMREELAVKWAMLLFGGFHMLRPQAGAAQRAFFSNARDVADDPSDPEPSQRGALLAAFSELLFRSIRTSRGLRGASTADIEWNGNPFWKTP